MLLRLLRQELVSEPASQVLEACIEGHCAA